MTTPSINSVSNSAASTAADTASRLPMKTLGQDDFLKLLVAQLSAQDPLNPQKDSDFIAQMAQFSSLEQAKTMQTDMSQMSSLQLASSAAAMIGKTVDLQLDATQTATGVVSAVRFDSGSPLLVVNGQSYDLSQVISLSPAPVTVVP